MNGFLNLDKPAGLTSHDCVAQVRRLLKIQRVGHGGTLDPAATGVLPIAIGKATRLLQYLPTGKAYRATIRFGVRTTTDDLQGEILSSQPTPELTLAQIQSCLPRFIGTIQQIPPRYSAIQVDGKRLYDLARAGVAVEVPVRSVQVEAIHILGWRPGESAELDVDITCGSGTYIRAIARDLGEAVQTGATLAVLLRTASSGFQLKDSLGLDALFAQVQAGTFQLIPPEVALQPLPLVLLSPEQAKRWSQGQRIVGADLAALSTQEPEAGVCRVHQQSGAFLGIGQRVRSQAEELLVPKLVWSAAD